MLFLLCTIVFITGTTCSEKVEFALDNPHQRRLHDRIENLELLTKLPGLKDLDELSKKTAIDVFPRPPEDE